VSLSDLLLVSAISSDQPSPPQAILFTVPFDKDAKFIGREDILIEIDKKFKVQRRVALAGIGGVGWVCLTIRVGIKLIYTGNPRSQSNTAINSEINVLRVTSFGYMLALSRGWIKPTRTLQGSSVFLVAMNQTLTHFN
jgi:hypothetical protein